MLLRLSTLATGRTGVRPQTAPRATRRCSTPASRRSSTSTARSAARATSRRSPTCALALIGEGTVRDASGALRRPPTRSAGHGLEPVALAREGGPGADQRHRRDARACSCWRCADLDRLLATADITAAMTVEALLGTDAVFAADLQALRPQAGPGASARQHPRAARRARRSSPATAGPSDTRVQDAYSLRCAPQVARRRPRHGRPRRAPSPSASSPRRSTTRW